jgi:uncharacterized protein YndB with AHSA1/START domain
MSGVSLLDWPVNIAARWSLAEEVPVPYNFTLITLIPASPQEIYEAWLDSIAHSEMTGGEALISDEIGAEVSAHGGYITGRILELVPGNRIVQSWRTTQFADEHEDSVVTVTLEDADEGTLLTLVHSNVPDEQTSYERRGWAEYYFEPMKAYFSEIKGKGVAEKAKAAPPKTKVAKTKLKRATTKAATAKRRPATATNAASVKKKPKKARVVGQAKAKRPTGTKRRHSRGAKRR